VADEQRRKWLKMPYSAMTGATASVNNPTTWSSFDAAVDPVTGNVTDECAADTIEILGSCTCTEVSPSGTGIRIMARGKHHFQRHRADW
jgi:primase-polymerase (primpol)-like protein